MIMICPRCNFRLASGAHICRTCGYVVPAKKEQKSETQTQAQTKPAPRTWSNVFSFGTTGKDKLHDEPALES